MIPAADTEKLKQFYSEVFGWKITKHPGPMEYWEIQTVPVDDKGMLLRQGVNGGMVKKETPEEKPVNYISVESIDKSIEKVKKTRWKNSHAKTGNPNHRLDSNSRGPRGKPHRLAPVTTHINRFVSSTNYASYFRHFFACFTIQIQLLKDSVSVWSYGRSQLQGFNQLLIFYVQLGCRCGCTYLLKRAFDALPICPVKISR